MKIATILLTFIQKYDIIYSYCVSYDTDIRNKDDTRMNKRISVLIILAAMLLSAISCGDSEGGKDTGTTAPDDNTSEAAETTDYIDTLGAKDFGGKTFMILAPPVTAIPVPNMHSGEING